MFYLFLLFCSCILYAGDQQNTIDKLVSAGKSEVFHTTKPTVFDAKLKQQYENLAKTDPEKFNRLVAYEQKKEKQNEKSSSNKKTKQ
jgi:hypothetical protein